MTSLTIDLRNNIQSPVLIRRLIDTTTLLIRQKTLILSYLRKM